MAKASVFGDALTEECPDIEMLAAYVDHNLTPEEQRVMEAHLAACSVCRRTVILTARTLRDLKSSDSSDSKE